FGYASEMLAATPAVWPQRQQPVNEPQPPPPSREPISSAVASSKPPARQVPPDGELGYEQSAPSQPARRAQANSGGETGARDAWRRREVSGLSLDWCERRLVFCERRQLLAEAWRHWSAPAKVAGLRAQLELLISDELRMADERRSRELAASELGGVSFGAETSERSTEENLITLKSLIVEFRQRLAQAIAEVPGASFASSDGPSDAGLAALTATLELGRGGFGRLLHAALFLYQKLRTLVPSELEATVKDPLSRLVPVPFYVLPYKVRLALKRGASGLARGETEATRSSVAQRAGGGSNGVAWMKARLEDLEDRLPLSFSDPVAVPTFLARLLRVRSAASAPKSVAGAGLPEPVTAAAAAAACSSSHDANFRDGLDLLLADSLTVYMSGWRSSHGQATAPTPASGRSASTSQTRRELRLGNSAACYRPDFPLR
ncbi:unnamed protein product, partial [Polarella glacialis]